MSNRLRPYAAIESAHVIHWLERAGATEMAMLASRCWPAGYRSTMPLPIEESRANPYLSASDAALRRRWPQPTAQALSEWQEVRMRWMGLMPVEHGHHWRIRRLVLLRSMVWPGPPESERPDPHVWPWRRLAREVGVHHETVQSWHATAIARLTAAVRELPGPGLQRIIAWCEEGKD